MATETHNDRARKRNIYGRLLRRELNCTSAVKTSSEFDEDWLRLHTSTQTQAHSMFRNASRTASQHITTIHLRGPHITVRPRYASTSNATPVTIPSSGVGNFPPGQFVARAPAMFNKPKGDAHKPQQRPGDNSARLTPFKLVQRLKTMCAKNDHYNAYQLLLQTPTGCQNLVVWNSMLAFALGAGKYKLAHKVFVDASASFARKQFIDTEYLI